MSGVGEVSWAERAAAAEEGVLGRHLRRVFWYPSAGLGRLTYPPHWKHRTFIEYGFWWQAHLLDCLIDAQLRDPTSSRRREIERLPFALRRRNWGRWLNRYYDDIAWLALALGRSERLLGIDHGPARLLIAQTLYEAWREDAAGGGIPWRRGDSFRNVPANASMAIVMARVGRIRRAGEALDWIHDHLFDNDTHLIREGVRPAELDARIFTYNQGLVLGAELELVRGGADATRLHRLVLAVSNRLATDGVLEGCGGGDGGLFGGITARYLAAVARDLPATDAASRKTRELAKTLVLGSAEAAWRNRAESPAGVFFGPDWSRPAVIPGRGGAVGHGGPSSDPPERDLSTQLAGWMLLEAAATVTSPSRTMRLPAGDVEL